MPPMPCTIRLATSADLPAINDIYNHYVHHSTCTYQLEPETLEARMAWFEHDGSRIYYEEQGSGTPVLLLPGFSQSIAAYAALRGVLAAAGYRVIAADLPGSGRSGPQPTNRTGPSESPRPSDP